MIRFHEPFNPWLIVNKVILCRISANNNFYEFMNFSGCVVLTDDILQPFYLYPIFFILPTPPVQCSLSLRGNSIDVRLGLVLHCHLPSVLLTAYCYYRITAYFWRQQKPQVHRKQEAQISWNFLSDSSFSHYLKVLCKRWR